VEQLGAGSGAESVQLGSEPLFEVIWAHGTETSRSRFPAAP
jgi:hypothetical protein